MGKHKLQYLAIISILTIFILIGVSIDRKMHLEEKPVFNEKSLNNFNNKEDNFSVGNYYLVKNNWLLGKFSNIIPDYKMQLYVNEINSLSKLAKSKNKDVYFVSMPHKTNLLKHLYPESIKNKNNIDLNKDSLGLKLDKNYISFIDIDKYFIDDFSEKERESFYFKTDHHWNGIGAFEGFRFMVNNVDLGISNEKINNYLSEYQIKVVKNKEFLGSYNRKLDFIVKEKEYANYVYRNGSKFEYFISDGNRDKKIKEESIMATRRHKKNWDYGGAYMRGTNCNIMKIKNKNSLVDKKALIFRDSYQAPMTWLLADIFSEVEIIDPRYIENIDMTYEEIINSSGSDIVMFMYNSFGFEGMIKEMIDKKIK